MSSYGNAPVKNKAVEFALQDALDTQTFGLKQLEKLLDPNAHPGDHELLTAMREIAGEDEEISPEELVHYVKKAVQNAHSAAKTELDLKHKTRNARFLKAGLGLVFFLLVLSILCNMGMMIYVVADAKDTLVDPGSSAMTVKGNNGSPAVDAAGEEKVIATRAAMRTDELHSGLSDDYFKSLRWLTLKAAEGYEGYVSMQVLATARYNHKASRCGTIVTIFTHLGEIIIDDEDIYFEENITNSFTLAGFT